MGYTPYTIGRNCSVVMVWNGQRVDMPDVTGFSANQEKRVQRGDPLNSTPVEFQTPSGWRGEFMVDRGSSSLDDLAAADEAAFWASGQIGSGSIYQYITEPDGSQSTYEFQGISWSLTNAGSFQADSIVKQRLSFFASQRVKVS